MSITAGSKFAGFGGDMQGLEAIPDVEGIIAANHAPVAVATHELNFPKAEHRLGDITKADFQDWPRVDLDWSSPACPPWTDARGVRRDFDKSTDDTLFVLGESEAERAQRLELQKRRALMEEVPRHLRAMAERGKPVLAGVVENVIQCRKWADWNRWIREIETAAPAGYTVRVIALNAMHAQAPNSLGVPQSRNRLFVGYCLKSLGRLPDWDKWLRPQAYCPTCDQIVSALQVWNKPGHDMGLYGPRNQYIYRCPRTSCRNQVIHPEVLPASVAIDASLDPGPKIGERVDAHGNPKPLKPRTMERIHHGLAKIVGEQMIVSTIARPGHPASTLDVPFGTQTTRRELAVVGIPPWITVLRGGGSIKSGHHAINAPLSTFSAQGQHQALIHPPQMYLMSYYGKGSVHPVDEPLGTFTTRDRYAVLGTPEPPQIDINDCTLRMVQNPEIRRGMGFINHFKIPKTLNGKDITDKQITTGYGNAVAPACAEIIGSALVEAITGQELPR